jgi:hypothetical protein
MTTIRRYVLPVAALLAAAAAVLFAFTQRAGAAPAPVVTAVTPAADTTGSQVVVSGSNLTMPPELLPTEILFGTGKAKVNSCAPVTGAASSCNVTVPPLCPGTPKVVDVRVIVGTLESAVGKADQFTYSDSGKPGGDCPSPGPSPSPSGTPGPAPAPTPMPGTGVPVTG